MRASIALPLLLTVAPASAQNWLEYVDETSTRVVGSPAAISDTFEKDLVAADLDLDGDEDLVVVRKVPFSFLGGHSNVLFMNEDGVLVDRTAQLIPTFDQIDNSRDVLAEDLTGDGWPDLVVAETIYEQPRMWRNLGEDSQGVFLGFEEDFVGLATLSSVMVKFCSVSAADVDGDGDLDLYFADYRNTAEDRLLINDGTGVFTDESATRLTPSGASGIFIIESDLVDYDGDGWVDVIKCEDGGLDLRIVYNDGTGHFFEEQAIDITVTHHVVSADFDNDGRMDLYVVDDFGDYLFRNGGPGSEGRVDWQLIPVPATLTSGLGGNAHGADLDQDGHVDVAVVGVDYILPSCEGELCMLRNMTGESGTLELVDPDEGQSMPWNRAGVHDLALMDIDGDSFLDLVLGTCTGIEVWTMVGFERPGTPYCTAIANSVGTTASVHAVGSASLATNDFRLVVEEGVPGQLGLFYYGPNTLQVPFGNGIRCVGGTTSRLHPSITMGTPGGNASRAVDFTQPPTSSGPGAITAGSTWNFQFWYRDPAAGGSFFNLSNGLSVTFQP